MAVTVTQLNNGMWFVHWISSVPQSETFQCGAAKLELTSCFSTNQVTLSLKEAQGNNCLNHSLELFTCLKNVFTVTRLKFLLYDILTLSVSMMMKTLTVEFLLLGGKCTGERKGKKRPRESESRPTLTNPGPLLPLKVRASYKGQMIEMKETCRGTWASVSWPIIVSENYNTKKYDDSSSEESDSDDDTPYCTPRIVARPYVGLDMHPVQDSSSEESDSDDDTPYCTPRIVAPVGVVMYVGRDMHPVQDSSSEESDSDGDTPRPIVSIRTDAPVNYATFQLILEFKDTSLVEGERQVLTQLSKLLDTQSMSDVTFIVKNEKIGAHSAIVVLASPVICAMLGENKFKEGRTKTVKIDDIEPSVFKEMLRYLYTGKAPKLDEDAMTEPLFLAADKYQIEDLKNCCERSLIKNVQAVVHYLVLAHLHSASQLLEASLKFLVEHKKEVWTRPEWKELNKSYPDLFFSASHRMAV
jgi:speckle-type POZ protein